MAAGRYICEVVGLVSSVEGLECEEFGFVMAFGGSGGSGRDGGNSPVIPPPSPSRPSSSVLFDSITILNFLHSHNVLPFKPTRP